MRKGDAGAKRQLGLRAFGAAVFEHFRPRGFQPRKLLLVAALSILPFALYNVSSYKIGFDRTGSIDCRVFFYESGRVDLQRGRYVLFRLSKEDLPREVSGTLAGLKLIKKVGCTTGEMLACSGGNCRCNGEQIGTPLPPDKATAAFSWMGPVPPNMLFVAGDHTRSYDSRIWGFLSQDKVEGQLVRCLLDVSR